jgi:peroxiredoxin Q/BCP
VIVGVSPDKAAAQAKFKDKFDLPFTLLSDVDHDVAEAYGTWVEKSMYGRKYMGVERSTFLLDGSGVLRGEWRKVRVPGHADEVLAAARAL